MKWRQKVRDDQGNEEGLGDSIRKKKKQWNLEGDLQWHVKNNLQLG